MDHALTLRELLRGVGIVAIIVVASLALLYGFATVLVRNIRS